MIENLDKSNVLFLNPKTEKTLKKENVPNNPIQEELPKEKIPLIDNKTEVNDSKENTFFQEKSNNCNK